MRIQTVKSDIFTKSGDFNQKMFSLHKSSLDIYKAKKTLESYKKYDANFGTNLA